MSQSGAAAAPEEGGREGREGGRRLGSLPHARTASHARTLARAVERPLLLARTLPPIELLRRVAMGGDSTVGSLSPEEASIPSPKSQSRRGATHCAHPPRGSRVETRGPIYDVPIGGERGSRKKGHSEGGCVYEYFPNAEKGEGVKKSEISADVISGSPLAGH